MKNQKNRLDQLFDQAKHQAPITSFSETKKRLIPAVSVGVLAGLLAKWGVLSTKLKFIIMLSTITILSTSALLIASSLSATVEKEESIVNSYTAPSSQNINLTSENGITKTVYYDNNEVVIKTTVDSSISLLIEELTVLEAKVFPEMMKSDVAESLEPLGLVESLSEDASSDTIRYTVNEKTTKSELDVIQAAALKAGIDFSVTTKIRERIIKRMKLKMAINGDGKSMSKSSFQISNGSTFSFTLGWIINDQGQATKFLKKRLVNCSTSVSIEE